MASAETHRAKIPPVIMAQVNLNDPDLERRTVRKFSFDAKYGKYLKHKTTIKTSCDACYKYQKHKALKKYLFDA